MARLSLRDGEQKDHSETVGRHRSRASWIAPVAAFAMTLLVPVSSCIITSTPDFEPPEPTPPFLVSENASPDLRQIVVVQPDQDEITFSAFVRSEDEKDDLVSVRLLIDYGTPSAGAPFGRAIKGKPVKSSTMADRSRIASAKLNRAVDDLSGCHRFTLMVSHAFDEFTDCPVDLSDSDSLTWNVFLCTSDMPECPPPLDPASDCALPAAPASCPQFSSDVTTSSGSTGGAP